MYVYHGSNSLFDVFDYDKIGTNGTSEGIGFYFTDNKKVARGYGENGYLYTIEFNHKKTLSHETKTIKKTELKEYLVALNEETQYLTNWGDIEYEGYQKVLNRAVDSEFDGSDNDVDLIAGICNASGNTEISLTMLYQILGYDSIVLKAEWNEQKLYIALTNDILKIVKVEKIGKL